MRGRWCSTLDIGELQPRLMRVEDNFIQEAFNKISDLLLHTQAQSQIDSRQECGREVN